MTRIQNKILFLSILVWIIMAAVWLIMNAYTQQSIEKYNEILNRYMLMNGISQLSGHALNELDRYVQDPESYRIGPFEQMRDRMIADRSKLFNLRNDRNRFELTNYYYLIQSQLDEMNQVVEIVQNGRDGDYVQHFEEATKMSQYLQDSALKLFSTELTTSEQFYREIIRQSEYVKRLGIWVLVMSSLILFMLSYRFARSITRPIIELTYAAKEISRGNFSNKVMIEGSSEMVFLARTFDRMREDLKNVIDEIQSKAQVEKDLQAHKLLLKESELKHLQSQINPHFLFNSLNILSKKAYLEGALETCELITSVSKLLRYNLRRADGTVTLQEELQVLDEYMTIQQARFMERVKYEIEVDSGCQSFLVPSLILQPIVENAFIYAIEPSEEGGFIHVKVKRRTDCIEVHIRDNGPGIPQDRIARILAGQAAMDSGGHSTGIGVDNVIQRLRLFYGTEDVMRIESELGQGTCFTLRLPKRGKET